MDNLFFLTERKNGKQTFIHLVGFENKAITLREMEVLEDSVHFTNLDQVSLSTPDCVLNQLKPKIKWVHRVPFERNSEQVNEHQYQYLHVSIDMSRGTSVFLYVGHFSESA